MRWVLSRMNSIPLSGITFGINEPTWLRIWCAALFSTHFYSSFILMELFTQNALIIPLNCSVYNNFPEATFFLPICRKKLTNRTGPYNLLTRTHIHIRGVPAAPAAKWWKLCSWEKFWLMAPSIFALWLPRERTLDCGDDGGGSLAPEQRHSAQ